MSPLIRAITPAAVPLRAVRFIMARSCWDVAGDSPRARAGSRSSSFSGTIRGWRKVPVFAVAVTDAMFSGLIWTWPWPIRLAAVSGPPEAGTRPSNVGTPACQLFRPSPNRSSASRVRESTFTSSAYFTNAVLQERAKLSARVACSSGTRPLRFWKVWLCQTADGGQGAGPFAVVRPLSMRVAALMIFMVEPGARSPRRAASKPSSRLLATASISPVLGLTATTEESGYFSTAFSAAAWALALSVVGSLPGLPLARVSSGVSAAWLPSAAAWWRITSSTPGRPPVLSPYRRRNSSRIGPRDGYVTRVSTLPSRSTASISGAAESPVVSVSPLRRRGWTTEGCQSTSARCEVSPRTTVSSLR